MTQQCATCGLALPRYLIRCNVCQKYFCNQVQQGQTESDAVRHMREQEKHTSFSYPSSIVEQADPACMVCGRHVAPRLSYFNQDGKMQVVCFASCVQQLQSELVVPPTPFLRGGSFCKTIVPVPTDQILALKCDEAKTEAAVETDAKQFKLQAQRQKRQHAELEQMSAEAITEELQQMEHQAQRLPKVPHKFNVTIGDISCVNGDPYAKRYFEVEIARELVTVDVESKKLTSSNQELQAKIDRICARPIKYDAMFGELINFNQQYEILTNMQRALDQDINTVYVRKIPEKQYFEFLIMGWNRYQTVSGGQVAAGDFLNVHLYQDGGAVKFDCIVQGVQERLVLRCSDEQPKNMRQFKTVCDVELNGISFSDVAQESIMKNMPYFKDYDVWRLPDDTRMKLSFAASSITLKRQRSAIKAIEAECEETPLYQLLLGKFSGSADAAVRAASQTLMPRRDVGQILRDVNKQIEMSSAIKMNETQESAFKRAMTECVTVVQGCPGGGKTFTAACIVQGLVLLHSTEQYKAKILCCSGSNTAADNIAVFCKKLRLNAMRVHAKSFMNEETEIVVVEEALELDMFQIVKRKLLGGDYIRDGVLTEQENQALSVYQLGEDLYNDWVSNQMDFDGIDPEVLMTKVQDREIHEHDIIISTCTTSASQRLMNQEFDAVVLDETSQAVEPMQMVAVQHTTKHLVIIGDHYQLGPSVMHPMLNAANLTRSLYLRMLNIGLKAVSLNVQYRMHSGLLEFPNSKFYACGIRSGITDASRQLVQQNAAFQHPYGLSHILKPGFPSLFIHVNGREELITASKSYQNQSEVDMICQLIRITLMEYKLQASEIGVITPYGAQTLLLQKDVQKISTEIEIGSVDSFQGREKEVVFFSAVRSNTENIGFLNDRRRLNVSMTRARRLFVVVGNGLTLAQNKIFEEMWAFYLAKGAVFEGMGLKDLKKVQKKGEKEKGDK